ncbi:MAG: signal peptidase I [Gammaproteobacteria bacterium]|nr:signal peptidase I [Gammaproteobacteria bacterium]
MNIDFPFWLLTAAVATGFILLVDKIYCYVFYSKQNLPESRISKIIEYSRSFFPVLLFVLILRSFLFEPFKVPTGSLEPTVLPGDFILSNKFVYGLRLPVWGAKIFPMGEPKNGEIAIFRTPVDNKTWMVKRVIGIPGDKIDYVDKKLIVNGIPAKYRLLEASTDTNDGVNSWPVETYQEEIFGIKHNIFTRKVVPVQNFHLTVPQGQYLMMGDNRDNSDDSRFWGFVPESNFEGKAIVIWMSWDQFNWKNIRWSRFGTWLNK